MPLPTVIEQQLKLAIEALSHIEEDTDDSDSKHAAQHALIKIRRMGLESPVQTLVSESAA